MTGDGLPSPSPAGDLPPLVHRQFSLPMHRRDAAAFLAAVRDHDIGDFIQLVGARLPMALEADRAAAEPVARRVIAAARAREQIGDVELVEDLEALLAGAPLAGSPVPVDLEEAQDQLDSLPDLDGSVLIDRLSGDLMVHWPDMDGDAFDDEDEPFDPDDERWIAIGREGSDEGWEDMEAFTLRIGDAAMREQLLDAIQGAGAFRRFRDRIHRADVNVAWDAFRQERALGRLRVELAMRGYRPVALPEEDSAR